MGTFIQDGAAVLPDVKTDARPASGATTEWASGDANKTRTALLDLRSQVVINIGTIAAEAAARAAADADIIASGAEPANVGIAPVIATGSTTIRTVADRFADVVNVLDYGADPTGVADSTTAFQDAFDAAGYFKVYIPPGEYKTTAPILWNQYAKLQVEGYGAIINANFDGFVIDKNSPLSMVEGPSSISGLSIINSSAGASSGGIRILGMVGMTFRDLLVKNGSGYKGNIGIQADNGNFTTDYFNCRVYGFTIGIAAGGHTNIFGCDVSHCVDGVRTHNTGFSLIGGRFEVNEIGINLGQKSDGALTSPSQGAVISGATMEANDVAIKTSFAVRTVVSGMHIIGSGNAPSGMSQIGIWDARSTETTVISCMCTGAYDTVAYQLDQSAVLVNCAGNNSIGSVYVDTLRTNRFIQCSGIEDGFHSNPSTGIYGKNRLIAAEVPSRNLRGVAWPVTPGASDVTCGFPYAWASNVAAAASATATAGAGLDDGTYYYETTVVTELGETDLAGNVIRSATCGSGNNQVTIAFGGFNPGGRWKHRIYRGTAPGVYDGYYDCPLNSNANFVDTGAAFDGTTGGPYSDPVPDGAEDDASYSVIATPSWDTTVYISDKTTANFKINFGTVAPAGTPTVDWFIVR